MVSYSFGRGWLGGGAHEVDFSRFVDLVKGRSIVSLASGEDFLELGLSGNVMVRIEKGGMLSQATVEVVCFSTANPEEPQSLALSLGEMPQGVPARQIEMKLRGLRTAFALLLLAERRDKRLGEYLRAHPFADLDVLLGDEGLEIESVSYGSCIAVVRSKARQAFDAMKSIATIFMPRVRDAYIKKLEADADLRTVEVARGEVALKREEFELSKARAEYVVDLVSRAGDVETQKILQKRLQRAIYELASGDDDESETRANARKLLSDGKRSKRKT
jgi:hypothetical protein